MKDTVTVDGSTYQYDSEKPYKDAELLEKLYCEKEMSQSDVADAIGCAKMTVCRWMNNLGIETRKTTHERPPYFYTDGGYERWKSKVNGDLQQLKVHRLQAVAEYGFDAVCNMDVHHKNTIPWDNRPENIELKSHSEHTQHHNHERHGGDQSPWKDKDKLQELYVREQMSTVEIAEIWGCNPSTISRWLDNYGIERRSLSEAQRLRYEDNGHKENSEDCA